MKTKILGLLAGALLAGSPASAATITVDGQQWTVGTAFGSASQLAATLEDQPWWGDGDLALSFATALGDKLGQPNQFGNGPATPLFAWSWASNAWGNLVKFTIWDFSCVGCVDSVNTSRFYAVAERVSAVPEPGTLALLGLGLAGLGLSRRRKVH